MLEKRTSSPIYTENPTMTNDYTKGWKYRDETDEDFRERRDLQGKLRRERRDLLEENPDRRGWLSRKLLGPNYDELCTSRSKKPHGGELQVHHRNGDPEGEAVLFCEKHNQLAAGHDIPAEELENKPWDRVKKRQAVWQGAGAGLVVLVLHGVGLVPWWLVPPVALMVTWLRWPV